jgi:hypothetical protein
MTWQIHIIRLDSAEERCSCFCVLFLGSRIGVFMSLMLRLLMIIDLIILQQFKLCSSNVFFYYIYNFFSVWITYVFCMIILKQFIFFFLFVFVIWIYLCVVHFYLVIQFAVNVHEKLWSFYPIKVLIMLECFDCWDLDWEAHLCERQLFSLLSIRYFSTTIQLLSVIYFPVTIHQIRCCC